MLRFKFLGLHFLTVTMFYWVMTMCIVVRTQSPAYRGTFLTTSSGTLSHFLHHLHHCNPPLLEGLEAKVGLGLALIKMLRNGFIV